MPGPEVSLQPGSPPHAAAVKSKDKGRLENERSGLGRPDSWPSKPTRKTFVLPLPFKPEPKRGSLQAFPFRGKSSRTAPRKLERNFGCCLNNVMLGGTGSSKLADGLVV